MKFDQSLHSLSEHIVSCMQINTSFIPKVYDDLTRCTNEQLMQISGSVGEYYDTTTQSIVQLTNRIRREEREELEREEAKGVEAEINDEIVFFD